MIGCVPASSRRRDGRSDPERALVLEKVLRRAGSDALKYFPVRLIPALTSLVTVKVFTTMISTTDYGNFYLITSTTALATSIATAWIASAIVRFYWIAKKDGREDAYISTTTWLTLASLLAASIVMAIGFWLFRDSLDPGLMQLVPIGLASFAASSLYTTLLQVLRAANKAKAFAILSISMTLVTTALSLWFVWAWGWGAFGILAGSVAGHAILIPFIMRDVAREGSLNPRHADREFFREFASYGVPLMISGLSGWILVLADRYVIAWLRTSAEVGLYSVAYGLGEKIMQLMTIPLILTITPMLIETYEKQGQELAQRVQTQFTRYFAMATFPLAAGMFVAGADFMRVFTGKQYWSAWPILGIVAVGVMCNGMAQLAGSGLGLYKKSRIIMTNMFAAAAFNVVANMLTVGTFGYMAAAYNTLAAYGLLLALTWYRTRKYMAWDLPWLDLGKITAACLTMVAILFFAFPGTSGKMSALLVQALAGVVVYAAALLVFQGLQKRELAYVGEMGRLIGKRLWPRSKDVPPGQ
jgi:O-antigen/teichoic acid export membrane protein